MLDCLAEVVFARVLHGKFDLPPSLYCALWKKLIMCITPLRQSYITSFVQIIYVNSLEFFYIDLPLVHLLINFIT